MKNFLMGGLMVVAFAFTAMVFAAPGNSATACETAQESPHASAVLDEYNCPEE